MSAFSDTTRFFVKTAVRFANFCREQGIEQAILTKELFTAWSAKQSTETKVTQNNRIHALTGFSRWLNLLGITSYVPSSVPIPEKTLPYLMEDADIQAFFEMVDRNPGRSSYPPFQRMSVEYKILFRLIYCCGLRNSETCGLRFEHADFNKGVLTITNAKGNKDRKVFLAEDLRLLCLRYQTWLFQLIPPGTIWVFPGKNPASHIPKTSVDRKFNDFWKMTKRAVLCDKKPTAHALRHAFVMKRMNLWMEADTDFRIMLPYLSTYLGHEAPIETFYYYHQTTDVFRTIRRKDKTSAAVIPEADDEHN